MRLAPSSIAATAARRTSGAVKMSISPPTAITSVPGAARSWETWN